MSDSAVVGLRESELPLSLLHRGKVREVYEVDAERLLMVASDRVSAFDVVMSEPIPDKGKVLTMLTAWWLDQLSAALPHHLISAHADVLAVEVPCLAALPRETWAGRSMLVRRTDPVLVECVIRGYLSGSAWNEYRNQGTLAGEPLPEGLQESDRLSPALFSPATKASEGHDQNITVGDMVGLLGLETTKALEARAHAIYAEGNLLAHDRGLILADSKFEFGVAHDGTLLLIDEVLTPDSSRYWPLASYAPGRRQPSLDKQPVRDFLDGLVGWDKRPPAPPLTSDVIHKTRERYRTLFRQLTGTELDDYEPPRRSDA